MTFVYLSSPYSHPDTKVRKARHDKVLKVNMALSATGMSVYCPIVSTAPMERAGLRLDHTSWMRLDKPFLETASILFVLCISGWRESEGVGLEITFFERARKPIFYLSEEADRSPLQGIGAPFPTGPQGG